MKRRVRAAIAAALVLTSLLWGGRVVLAEETLCSDILGAVTVDNLRVPQNASCTLDGTRVEGTIYVENGALLTAWRVTVIGNIQAEGAQVVKVLDGSSVGGSIQLKQGGAARVDQVRVNGDIQFDSNQGALSATRNQVGGNIQVFQNTSGVDIVENTVDGNLQCKENDPVPTGGNNVVQGNKEDQCANLSPGDTTPPDTTILAGPSRASESEATFAFSGSDDATPQLLLLFECALDGAAFEACDSPYVVQGLADSEHRFQVRGLDLALNADPVPATHTWTTGTRRIYLPLIVWN